MMSKKHSSILAIGAFLLAPIASSCVGHDTNLTGSNPVAGIYRQAKRMASR